MQYIDSAVRPLGLDPQFRAEWRQLSYNLRRGDLTKRFTISEVVPRMRTLINLLKEKNRLNGSVLHQAVLFKLQEVQDIVDGISSEQFSEIFKFIDDPCRELLVPHNYEDTIIVLQDFQRALEQRYSSLSKSSACVSEQAASCLGDSSDIFFRKLIEKLLNVLCASVETYRLLEAQWPDTYKYQTKETEPEGEDVDSLPEWFIGSNELENEEYLTSGGFGEVWKAKWLNSDVAVKRLIIHKTGTAEDEKRREQFLHEVALWFRLNHPYVVKLFGGCHVGKKAVLRL